MSYRFRTAGAFAFALALVAVSPLRAQTLGADFAAAYTVNSLGSVGGLPSNYGGLTFLDNNTLLVGGAANGASGRLYTVGVVRDASSNHITGFSGNAQQWATDVGEYNDGGVVFGPGGVLFTSRWPVNELGQTKPGSSNEDKVINLAAMGVVSSHSAINFVPSGFGGAGQAKLVSYGGGEWYSANLVPDGGGTYDLNGLVRVDLDPGTAGVQNVPGGPEGFVYIGAANTGFGVNSLLISEYAAGTVGAYAADADGNPLVASRRTFLSGLSGAEGATIDPLTGDFLFSTFGGGSRIVVVSGFIAPQIPEPGTWAMLILGLGAVARRVARQARR